VYAIQLKCAAYGTQQLGQAWVWGSPKSHEPREECLTLIVRRRQLPQLLTLHIRVARHCSLLSCSQSRAPRGFGFLLAAPQCISACSRPINTPAHAVGNLRMGHTHTTCAPVASSHVRGIHGEREGIIQSVCHADRC
jgi:hypothetical protein